MSFETKDNKENNLEAPKTKDVLDNKKNYEAGEISPESLNELTRAEANISEIASLNEEETIAKLENDPEKQSKVANMLAKVKEYALIVAGAAGIVGSVAYEHAVDMENTLNALTELQTVSATSPTAISGFLVMASTVFTIGAVIRKSYVKFSKEYDAEQALKKQAI